MYAIVTMNGMNAAYQNIYHHNIFDGIDLPEGIDSDILIDRIMIRCGEFSVMHTNIDYMHHQILNFFKVHKFTFEKWLDAITQEFNPIENYDRYEEYEGGGTNESSGTSSGTSSGSNTDTLTKAAYNSSTYEPYEKNTGSVSSTDSGSSSSDGEFTEEHESHIHGNIGVTTSQQMIQSSIDLYGGFNIYIAISDMFCDEFCIMVY